MNNIAPFRSRSEALKLSRVLNEERIANIIINTPRNLGVSCGLSVVFNENYIEKVRSIIAEKSLTSSLGIFR